MMFVYSSPLILNFMRTSYFLKNVYRFAFDSFEESCQTVSGWNSTCTENGRFEEGVTLPYEDDDFSVKNSLWTALTELFKLEFGKNDNALNMTSQPLNDSRFVPVCDNKTFVGSFYPVNIKNREWDFLRVVIMLFIVVLHYIPMSFKMIKSLKTVLGKRRQRLSTSASSTQLPPSPSSPTPRMIDPKTTFLSQQEFYQSLHKRFLDIFPRTFLKLVFLTYIGVVVITVNLFVYDIFAYEYDIEGQNDARCANGIHGDLNVYYCPWYNYRHYYSMWKSFLISLLLATFLYNHVIHTNNIKFSEGSFFDCFGNERTRDNRTNENTTISFRTSSNQTESHHSSSRSSGTESIDNIPLTLIIIQFALIIILTVLWYIFYQFYDEYMARRIVNKITGELITETKLQASFDKTHMILFILLSTHFIVLSLVSFRVLVKIQLQEIQKDVKQTEKVLICLKTISLAILTGGLVSHQKGEWKLGWRRIKGCKYMVQCLFRVFGFLLYVGVAVILHLRIDVGF